MKLHSLSATPAVAVRLSRRARCENAGGPKLRTAAERQCAFDPRRSAKRATLKLSRLAGTARRKPLRTQGAQDAVDLRAIQAGGAAMFAHA
jgi:hypothetical protein